MGKLNFKLSDYKKRITTDYKQTVYMKLLKGFRFQFEISETSEILTKVSVGDKN